MEFSRTLEAQKEGDFDRYTARLLCVANQCDLAVFTIDDAKFWEGAVQLSLGGDLRVQQSIDVCGYPAGGEGLSITHGVVSRLDWEPYVQSGWSNLRATVDAAINPGNSGGPALSKGQVSGVAFQKRSDLESNGSIIPVAILRRLLDDFLASYDPMAQSPGPIAIKGFGRFCARFQQCESPILRASLKLPPEVSGVVIRGISQLSNLHATLKNGDVVAAVDGYSISNTGRVRLPGNVMVDYRGVVTRKLVGESFQLTVYRAGQKNVFDCTVENPPELLKRKWYAPTQYFLFGGILFTPHHLHSSDAGGEEDDDDSYLARCTLSFEYNDPSYQVVYLRRIFPHKLLKGYDRHDTGVTVKT